MANVWREPIFDRTQADVDFAMNKIAEWIVYNISSAEYDEKVRIENETLILREGNAVATQDALLLQGDGRAYVENDALVVKIGVVYDLKGCLNVLDINRIESNIKYISEKLLELSYPNTIISREWDKDNLPTEIELQRIIHNVRELIATFYQPKDAPTLPNTMLVYDDVNALERNIDLIKYLLDCMVNSFKKVGATKSGTRMILPIRR